MELDCLKHQASGNVSEKIQLFQKPPTGKDVNVVIHIRGELLRTGPSDDECDGASTTEAHRKPLSRQHSLDISGNDGDNDQDRLNGATITRTTSDGRKQRSNMHPQEDDIGGRKDEGEEEESGFQNQSGATFSDESLKDSKRRDSFAVEGVAKQGAGCTVNRFGRCNVSNQDDSGLEEADSPHQLKPPSTPRQSRRDTRWRQEERRQSPPPTTSTPAKVKRRATTTNTTLQRSSRTPSARRSDQSIDRRRMTATQHSFPGNASLTTSITSGFYGCGGEASVVASTTTQTVAARRARAEAIAASRRAELRARVAASEAAQEAARERARSIRETRSLELRAREDDRRQQVAARRHALEQLRKAGLSKILIETHPPAIPRSRSLKFPSHQQTNYLDQKAAICGFASELDPSDPRYCPFGFGSSSRRDVCLTPKQQSATMRKATSSARETQHPFSRLSASFSVDSRRKMVDSVGPKGATPMSTSMSSNRRPLGERNTPVGPTRALCLKTSQHSPSISTPLRNQIKTPSQNDKPAASTPKVRASTSQITHPSATMKSTPGSSLITPKSKVSRTPDTPEIRKSVIPPGRKPPPSNAPSTPLSRTATNTKTTPLKPKIAPLAGRFSVAAAAAAAPRTPAKGGRGGAPTAGDFRRQSLTMRSPPPPISARADSELSEQDAEEYRSRINEQRKLARQRKLEEEHARQKEDEVEVTAASNKHQPLLQETTQTTLDDSVTSGVAHLVLDPRPQSDHYGQPHHHQLLTHEARLKCFSTADLYDSLSGDSSLGNITAKKGQQVDDDDEELMRKTQSQVLTILSNAATAEREERRARLDRIMSRVRGPLKVDISQEHADDGDCDEDTEFKRPLKFRVQNPLQTVIDHGRLPESCKATALLRNRLSRGDLMNNAVEICSPETETSSVSDFDPPSVIQNPPAEASSLEARLTGGGRHDGLQTPRCPSNDSGQGQEEDSPEHLSPNNSGYSTTSVADTATITNMNKPPQADIIRLLGSEDVQEPVEDSVA